MTTDPRFVPGCTPAPRNQWYVVAFDDEVTATPLARKILGEPLVLFRGENGAAVALLDRCAHRAATLSTGKVIGNTIQCFYHGLQYDGSGRCVHIPSQPNIPSKMKVRRFAVIEKGPLIWIWMGNADEADPARLPDYSLFGLDDPSNYIDKFFRMDIDGNGQLLHENLLDVSHISFLHEGDFDTGAICKADGKTEVFDTYIQIDREVEETLTGPYAFTFEFEEGTRVRRILRSRSWVHGLNVITNIFWDLDKTERGMMFNHAVFPITPKDDHSCHYFTVTVKNYGAPVMPDVIKQTVWNVFLTDKAAIEAIQSSYDLLGADTPDCSVKADGAAMRYRRMVSDALTAEQSPATIDGAAE